MSAQTAIGLDLGGTKILGLLVGANGEVHRQTTLKTPLDGVEALLLDYAPVAASSPLPYFMAMGSTLTREVKTGELIMREAITPPTDSILWQLRAQQDEMRTA